MPPVTLETAKSIAAKYHGGEFSPLLAFVGHGRAFPSAIDETIEILKRSSGEKRKELNQLASFLEANNEHAKHPTLAAIKGGDTLTLSKLKSGHFLCRGLFYKGIFEPNILEVSEDDGRTWKKIAPMGGIATYLSQFDTK